MALEKPQRSNAPAGTEGGMTQRRRWIVFGSNVAVAIVLAVAAAAVVVWLSGTLLKGRARGDWTAGGRFSLSPRTKAVLGDLAVDIRVAFVCPNPADYQYISEEAYRRDLTEYERVRDLLEAYDVASGRVSLKYVDPLNPVQAEAYLNELRESFKEGFDRKQKLLGEFAAFRDEVDAFVEKEIEAIKGFAKISPRPAPALLQSLTSAANELLGLSRKAQLKMFSQMLGQDLAPGDEKATLEDAKTLTANVRDGFKEYAAFYTRVLEAGKAGELGGAVPAEIAPFLETSAQRYDPLRLKADALNQRLSSRADEKFDDIEQRLQSRGKCVVVQGPGDVQILSPDDMWVQRPGDEEAGGRTEGVFSGERAFNAALLGVTSQDKPAVIFCTFAGQATQWNGPYAQVAERLRSMNFLVEDWDLMRSPEPPRPEHMSQAIYVVVPPPQMNPQQPMPPATPESYQAVIDLVKGGAPAILLGEPGGMFAPKVPYADLFDLFGVNARLEAVAVQRFVEDSSTGRERAFPRLEITSYPAGHPISKPMGGLPTMMFTASPLEIRKDLPPGVTAVPIVEMPGGPDTWADTVAFLAMRGEAKFDPADDLVGPLPLAVAATRLLPRETPKTDVPKQEEPKPDAAPAEKQGADATAPDAKDASPKTPDAKPAETKAVEPVTPASKPLEQRVVLFGDADFISDRVAFYRDPFGREAFPGDVELFINCLLWVAKADNLIATSPEALLARRIGDLGGWGLPIQIAVVGGLPAAVLVIGLIVHVIRRR